MSAHPPPAPPARSGVITALMILAGIILLLPGLCVGAVAVAFTITPQDLVNTPWLVVLWLVCFAVTAGGIALIWRAVRRLRA